MNYFKGFLFLIFISSALSENSENDLKDCYSEHPQLDGIYASWRTDETCFIIEYNPPLGYEHCDFQYKISAMIGRGIAYNATTNSLMHHFNYVKQKIFCSSILIEVTPILNGHIGPVWMNQGRLWSFYGVVGPVNSLDVTVTDALIVTWTIPEYFEQCNLQYHILVTSVSGRILVDHINYHMFEYIYDYSSDNMFCEHVLVSVTAVFENNGGTAVNKFAKLGGQGGASC